MIILLGRVADVARVEDRDRHAPRLDERSARHSGGVWPSGTKRPCMNESPDDQPADRRLGSGSGPRQPQEFVDWNDSGMTPSCASASGRADLGDVRQEEEAGEAMRERVIAAPEGAEVGPHPIGAAGVVGLEDLRREDDGPVVIRPPEQRIVRRHPGGREDAPPGGRGFLLEEIAVDLPRLLDPALSLEPPLGLDVGSARRQADHGLAPPPDPIREPGDGIAPARRPDGKPGQPEDGDGQDRGLEPALEASGPLDRRQKELPLGGGSRSRSGASFHGRSTRVGRRSAVAIREESAGDRPHEARSYPRGRPGGNEPSPRFGAPFLFAIRGFLPSPLEGEGGG